MFISLPFYNIVKPENIEVNPHSNPFWIEWSYKFFEPNICFVFFRPSKWDITKRVVYFKFFSSIFPLPPPLEENFIRVSFKSPQHLKTIIGAIRSCLYFIVYSLHCKKPKIHGKFMVQSPIIYSCDSFNNINKHTNKTTTYLLKTKIFFLLSL